MKIPDYTEETYSEEEIALLEQAGLADRAQTPLLDSEFDAIWDAIPPNYPCIYFPANLIFKQEEEE